MRLWLFIIWAHLLALASADDFQIVPLTSPLYVFNDGWQGQTDGVFTGNATTSGGSVLFSFRGPLLSIPTSASPDADVVWWIDGVSWGSIYHESGAVQNVALQDKDHQVMLQVQSADSGPWVFPGFALPVSNITSKHYLPTTFGVNATTAPSQAIILDNKSNCVKYSEGFDVYDRPSDNWMHYGDDVGTSLWSLWNIAVTVYFHGTDIWMFGPESAYKDRVSMSVSVDSNVVSTTDVSYPQRDIPLYQALLWHVSNLTNDLHSVTFTVHLHDNNDLFSVDFFRYLGTSVDCSTFTQAIPQGDGDTPQSISQTSWLMETWAFIFAFFIAVVLGLNIAVRLKERKRLRKQKEAQILLQSSPTDKSDILASELNVDGIQMMPLSSLSEDPPTILTTTAPTITPFAMALGYTTRPQRRKEIPSDPRFMPTGVVDPENSATQDSEPTSPVPEGLLFRPESVYRPANRDENAGLPDWTPPPPSYLTELHPHRPLQLLSEDDLSRLVDRVANLRARNRVNRIQSSSQDTKPRALLDPPLPQPQLTIHIEAPTEASDEQGPSTQEAVNGEEETTVENSHHTGDDALEELARRIVRPDRGSSSQDELT